MDLTTILRFVAIYSGDDVLPSSILSFISSMLVLGWFRGVTVL